MRRQPPPPMPAAAIPTLDGMFSVWRADRCVQDASAHNYIRWIKWFRFYVNCLGLEERAELTQEGACRFAEWYGRHRRVDHKKMARAQTALHALNRVYEVMGLHPPKWSAPRPPVRPASALLQEYADCPSSGQPAGDGAETADPCRQASRTSRRSRQDLVDDGARGH